MDNLERKLIAISSRGELPRYPRMADVEGIACKTMVAGPSEEDFDPGPPVCPGCYALGDAPCASWCPDAAIERRQQEESERGEDDG